MEESSFPPLSSSPPYPSSCSSTNYTTKTEAGNTLIFDAITGAELHRHADLWLNDGSVICRAENTLFRVHMSQLARHSVCFRDMFSLPQPHSHTPYLELPVDYGTGSARGDVERIPVVELHDAPEDVGSLLAALYDGPSFGNNDQDDFRVVAGILKLSTKYIIDPLREKALEHLSIAWPRTLKAWDLREDLARSYEMEATDSSHLYPHPIAVINLAREVDTPSLLPSAFYDLSRYSYTQIFEPTEDDVLYRPNSTVPQLSAHDMQCLALGKESAQHSITSLIQAMGNSQYVRQAHHTTQTHARKTSAGGVCISAAACRKDFSELVDLATQHYLFDREKGYCDPLYVAEELGQLKSAEFSECQACAKALEMWAAKERERMWKLIPSWFRLEGGGGDRVGFGESGSPPPLHRLPHPSRASRLAHGHS